MALVTVGNVREALELLPLRISNESLGTGDGSTKDFLAKQRPIVDWDYDGDIKDDVVVKVAGQPATVSSVTPDKGIITLSSAPTNGQAVTGTYYWSPLSDNEINKAIASAVADAEAETAMRIEEVADDVWEEILYEGNVLDLPEYPVTSIKKVEVDGVEVTSGNYTFNADGILTLTNYMAGEPTEPYFKPSKYSVKVTYTHGWTVVTIPGDVYEFILRSAVLSCLRVLDRKLAISPEYMEKWVVEFKEKNLGPRIGDLVAEVESLRLKLPKAVGSI